MQSIRVDDLHDMKAIESTNRYSRLLVKFIAIGVGFVTVWPVALCHAQCDIWGCSSRGTLMHWGEGFTGGPDLCEPLVTDRPDFTEASSTVGLGVTQFELGYTYTFDNDGLNQTISHSAPESLSRHGILANWLELRIGWNYFNEEIDSVGVSGNDDLYLGFKIGLTPQQGVLPEMALIPQMTVPTGDDDFTADKVLGGLNWVYAWDIGECFSLAGSTQFNESLDVTDSNYTEWAQSLAGGVSLTDDVGGYVEWFALLPDVSGVQEEHYLNGGFTVLLTDDILWDIRAGVGLNDEADDYFVGSGISIRLR